MLPIPFPAESVCTFRCEAGGVLGKHISIKNKDALTGIAIRAGFGFPMNIVQKHIHQAVLPEEEQQVADDIELYNHIHLGVRLGVSHYFDNFLVNKLPTMIFNTCQSSPTMSVLVSPRSVRLYERVASSVLYYGIRDLAVGQ